MQCKCIHPTHATQGVQCRRACLVLRHRRQDIWSRGCFPFTAANPLVFGVSSSLHMMVCPNSSTSTIKLWLREWMNWGIHARSLAGDDERPGPSRTKTNKWLLPLSYSSPSRTKTNVASASFLLIRSFIRTPSVAEHEYGSLSPENLPEKSNDFNFN